MSSTKAVILTRADYDEIVDHLVNIRENPETPFLLRETPWLAHRVLSQKALDLLGEADSQPS